VSKSSRKIPAGPSPRRLNLRALILLAILVFLPLTGLFALRVYQDYKGRATFLVEARRAFDEEKYDYAIKYVNRYLEGKPDSIEGLELKGRILAKSIRDFDGLREAIRVQQQILARVRPGGPEDRAAQKQLVELNLKGGNWHAAEVAARKYLEELEPEDGPRKVAPGDPDAPAVAEASRLLARALVGVSEIGGAGHERKARDEQTGKPIVIAPLDEAILHYERAEALRPGDISAGIGLAMLYSAKEKDPKKAEALLQNLKKNNKDSVPARLALFRYYFGQPDGAGVKAANVELNEALALAPGNADARLVAAELANQRGDTKAARDHLGAIKPVPKNDLRLKLIEGLIAFREQHPDQGIESWREGLVQTGGSDAEMTWRLAHVLLRLGRLDEAKPLMNRYRGLTGGGDAGTPEYRLLAGMEQLRLGNVTGRKSAEPRDARKEKTEEEKGALGLLEEIRQKIGRDNAVRHLVTLGDAYAASGLKDGPARAMESYRAAADMAGAGSLPFEAMARVQLADGKTADAIASLESGLRQAPDDPSLLSILAQVLLRQEMARPKDRQDWAAFEARLGEIERRAPKLTEIAMVRADYLAAVGRLDEAMERIGAAVKDAPKSVGPWMARVNALTRLGRFDEALAALAEATRAAGEHAQFRAAQSRLLNARGEPTSAYEALAKGLDLVPADEKPMLWAALGEYHQSRGDIASARRAYEEWSRLVPRSAEPRLALLRLASAADDVPAILAQADAIKAALGPDSVVSKAAWVEAQLKVKPREPGDKAPEDKARLAEIARVIEEIKKDAPRQPSGALLDATLKERRGETGAAIEAYRAALDLRGGNAALKPLVVLLAREKRYAEIEDLHRKVAAFPADLDQLASVLALQMGDAAQAEQMVQRMVQGDPQGLDAAVWRARVLKQNGKEAEAEQALDLLVQQRPDDPNAWVQLMMLQLAIREPARAKATFERMKARVKADGNELLWAACYRALGMMKEAGAAYSDALARRPDDLKLLQAAVEFYEAIGQAAPAEKSLRRMLEVRPRFDWARRRLALHLSARPNDPAAWQEAMRLVGEVPKGPESPDDRLLRANVLSRSADPKHRDEAIAILEALAAELPGTNRLNEVLAKGLVAVGRREKAREYAARAASVEGALDAVAFYAALLIEEKDLAEAEKQLAVLEKQVVDPNSLTMVELRARLLHAKGDDAGAAAAVRRGFDARKAAPDALAFGTSLLRLLIGLKLDAAEGLGADLARLGPQGKNTFAEYLGSVGKVKEAKALQAEATKADASVAADAARSSLRLATEAASPGEWLDQADGLLSLALKGQAGSVDLLQTQAMLRHMQGKYDAEIKTYQDILAKNPNAFTFMNNWAWTLSEEMNRPEEGLRKIDEAISRVGRESHLVDTRGVILLRLNRVEDAVEELKIAAAALPTSGPILFHLARAYKKAGRQADFEKYRDMARKLGLKPEKLQPSEQDEAKALLDITAPGPVAASKP
jgi:predicted Zn-dependent protease